LLFIEAHIDMDVLFVVDDRRPCAHGPSPLWLAVNTHPSTAVDAVRTATTVVLALRGQLALSPVAFLVRSLPRGAAYRNLGYRRFRSPFIACPAVSRPAGWRARYTVLQLLMFWMSSRVERDTSSGYMHAPGHLPFPQQLPPEPEQPARSKLGL
jgi:hypothetical protein